MVLGYGFGEVKSSFTYFQEMELPRRGWVARKETNSCMLGLFF